MYRVFVYLALFIIYSFLGWLMESVVCYLCDKKFVNRGFLVGPVCPIYGVGCILIVVLLDRYKDAPLLLFVVSMILCSFLEYVTSYLMEKIFKARWWDYSENKFNLNGRICLKNIVAFGVLGILIVYYVNPFFVSILYNIDVLLLKVIVSILLILFLFDLCISTKVIYNVKGVGINLFQDSTEEISTKVKEILMSKGMFSRRIVNAFPSMNIRIKEKKSNNK